jgi:competence protein ComGC
MNPSLSHNNFPLRRNGFSFFEMMMFVAILGIIVAMVVPMWGNNDAFYAARDRRNAQELVSTSMMAQASGLNFVNGDNLLDILREVSRGGVVTRGPMKGRGFSVPGLSEEDLKGAAKYVQLKNGALHYSFESDPITPGNANL